jgi:5-hmdU DNA kinase, helical domain
MVARRPPADVRFVDFVAEREQVRLRRAAGQPAPWTEDPILRTYRFTNIRRRDDRVSVWLREHVYSSAAFAAPTLAALQFAALCRWVNWPPTLAAIMEAGLWPADHLDLRRIGRLLDQRTRSGKTWTGAYMIRAAPLGKPKGQFIVDQVVGRALRRAWPELQFMLQTGMRRPVWRVLVGCLHWGSFLSGQVVDDLTWTPILANPRDDRTWAPQGPGSLRGLNRVLGLPLGVAHEELAWCEHLLRLRSMVVERLGMGYLDITAHDCQSCLCEWDKHERVRLGQGFPRSLYRPETAF